MQYHVLRLTKTRGGRARYGIVRLVESFLSGALVLEFVEGHQNYYNDVGAHAAAQELERKRC